MVNVDVAATSGVRTDAATGVTETLAFFGGEERLFGSTYTPAEGTEHGVVICPSIHAELITNYRKEVLLARELAAAGFAVQRFHYRGMGNSDGAIEELTFETLEEDVVTAARHLDERTGVTSIAFVGIRYASLVAAAAARRYDGAPLALWDPVVEARSFFREVMRARLIGKFNVNKEGEGAPPAKESLADLSEKDAVDVLGYPITGALYSSGGARSLAQELGDDPRPIMMIQFTRKETVRPDLAKLDEALTAKGFETSVSVIVGQPAWWFPGERLRAREDVDTTVAWLSKVSGRKVA